MLKRLALLKNRAQTILLSHTLVVFFLVFFFVFSCFFCFLSTMRILFSFMPDSQCTAEKETLPTDTSRIM